MSPTRPRTSRGQALWSTSPANTTTAALPAPAPARLPSSGGLHGLVLPAPCGQLRSGVSECWVLPGCGWASAHRALAARVSARARGRPVCALRHEDGPVHKGPSDRPATPSGAQAPNDSRPSSCSSSSHPGPLQAGPWQPHRAASSRGWEPPAPGNAVQPSDLPTEPASSSAPSFTSHETLTNQSLGAQQGFRGEQ